MNIIQDTIEKASQTGIKETELTKAYAGILYALRDNGLYFADTLPSDSKFWLIMYSSAGCLPDYSEPFEGTESEVLERIEELQESDKQMFLFDRTLEEWEEYQNTTLYSWDYQEISESDYHME